MSKRASRAVGLVCEGPSDFVLFEAVVRKLWPAINQVLPIQPQVDALTRHAQGSSGWSGVKSWCQENANKFDLVLDPGIGPLIDILVVAVDADIAAEALDPASTTNPESLHPPTQLREQVKSWLGFGKAKSLPAEVVISTPSMAIEAWVIAALFPSQRAPEAIRAPTTFLIGKRKLVIDPKRPHKARKSPETYRQFATALADNLGRVRKRCPEAERTAGDIEHRRRAVER